LAGAGGQAGAPAAAGAAVMLPSLLPLLLPRSSAAAVSKNSSGVRPSRQPDAMPMAHPSHLAPVGRCGGSGRKATAACLPVRATTSAPCAWLLNASHCWSKRHDAHDRLHPHVVCAAGPAAPW
jgi:hypothetical protein